MTRSKKTRGRKLRRWTREDLKLLRAGAGEKSPLHVARTLRRTPAAVRLMASKLRISLRQR
jgi:hypothetical protein